jgi:hypothetical protein
MNEVLEAIQAGHHRNRHAPVGLVDILERYDASQRALLTHAELDAALRRLTESGAIRDIGQRMFVVHDATPERYTPLTEAEYREAVNRYKDDFADTVAWLMRLPFFRRFAPAPVDADHVAISFAIERVVAQFGGQLGDVVERAPLRYPVSLPDATDRETFLRAVRDALRERSLGERETWLMFADGDRARVGGSGDIPRR